MDALRDTLLVLGIPGLFLIALLDSAGVPLPGGVDVLLLLLVWRQPSQFFVTALAAATGATLGCLVLYRVGRAGGDRALRRLDPEKRRRVTRRVRENDVAALLVAVLAPPPFPTKVFMLAAGIVGVSWTRFAAAVFVGRLVRFTGEAYLAVRLGDRAAEVLQQHYPTIGAALVLSVCLYFVVKRLRGRRRAEAG